MNVDCPYCQQPAKLVTGEIIYPHRPDLFKREFWLCRPCEAWVGCHKNSSGMPFGRLANPQLRKMKQKAHHYFDQIWKGGYLGRKAAYSWLADKMGLKKHKCHIGYFDEIQCAQAVRHSKRFLRDNCFAVTSHIDGPFRNENAP